MQRGRGVGLTLHWSSGSAAVQHCRWFLVFAKTWADKPSVNEILTMRTRSKMAAQPQT